jgi:hypothetical protein
MMEQFCVCKNCCINNKLHHVPFVFLLSHPHFFPCLNLKWQIKRLDPVTGKVTTVAGTGRAGYKDGPGLSAQVSLYLEDKFCYLLLQLICVRAIMRFILNCDATLVSCTSALP